MNNIYYAIASYHRPKCKTYHALKECGIEDERIVISLNDSNDFKTYVEALGSQAQIITRRGNNVASNRNNILNYFENGAKIILLDDDIRDFRKWEEKQGNKCGAQKKITELDKTFNEVFSFMQKNNIHFMGCLPTTNNMNIANMLRKGETYSFNTLVQCGLCFVIKSEEIKFDEKWDMLEDYELNLRMIRQGYIIARINNIVPNKSYMGKEKGGMYDRYQRGEQELWLRRLVKKYPDMVTKKDRTVLLKRKWRI